MAKTERYVLVLDVDKGRLLEALARERFAGKVSAALEAALEAALVIYDEPLTYRSPNGSSALEMYCEVDHKAREAAERARG